jgi:Secretion system C-terminal sorting domain
MRKFLLILLNVLCLAGAFGQTRVFFSEKKYDQKNPTDTLKLSFEGMSMIDSKTCLDSTYRYINYDYRRDGKSKLIREYRYKYDKRGEMLEEIRRDSLFTRLSETTPFVYKSYYSEKQSYIYTPISVRADTIFVDVLDTVTKKWQRKDVQYIRKPGIGNDTFKTATQLMVYDPNANMILEVIKNALGQTTDSTRIKYDNKIIMKSEYFSVNQLGYKESRIYNYLNNKLDSELFLRHYSETVIDTTLRKYYYKNDLLDSEENETKSILYEYATKVKTIQNHTKTRFEYQYDRLGKESGNKTYTWDFKQNLWVLNQSYTSEFSLDSLNKKVIRLTYTSGVLSNTNTANIIYKNCVTTVSSSNEIDEKIDFTLAPNPTTGSFNLSLSSEAIQAGARVSVYNLQGIQVYNNKVTSELTTVDISHLSKGFYLVKVADKTHSSVKKLILN